MGCDIHTHVEVKNRETGKWEEVRIENPYRSYTIYDKDGNSTGETYHPLIEAYDGRDYELFGILAGVRSSIYKQIDDPRGIPTDVSDTVLEDFNQFVDDNHTPSWYTLGELYMWYDNKKNFRSVNYKDKDVEPYLDEIKREDKRVRERFLYFTWAISNLAEYKTYYFRPDETRVVFWFDN